jgi:hypothetical protein
VRQPLSRRAVRNSVRFADHARCRHTQGPKMRCCT